MQYYFVAAALPPLDLDEKPELSLAELRALYALNLTERDQELVHRLLVAIDLSNLRALWQELPLDERGPMSAKELEAAVLVKSGFPPFVIEFLERYESIEERLRNFGELSVALTQFLLEAGGFLARFALADREMRLVLAALRAKRLKRDLLREMQFEDFGDPLVASILAQKDAATYTPPSEYERLPKLMLHDPKTQEHELLQERLKRIEELEGQEPFSIDHLLGYLLRLELIEAWHSLDEPQGLRLIRNLTNYG